MRSRNCRLAIHLNLDFALSLRKESTIRGRIASPRTGVRPIAAVPFERENKFTVLKVSSRRADGPPPSTHTGSFLTPPVIPEPAATRRTLGLRRVRLNGTIVCRE